MPRVSVAETVTLAVDNQLVRRNRGYRKPEVKSGTPVSPGAWPVPCRRYHVGVSHGCGAERVCVTFEERIELIRELLKVPSTCLRYSEILFPTMVILFLYHYHNYITDHVIT